MEKLTIFIITWNQERYIKEIIDYYRNRIPDAKFVIYDNESTDKTVEICKENGCKVISFSTGGKMDEQTLINIRNSCWQNVNTKYVLIIDDDEYLDITQELLEDNSWNVVKAFGYEMFDEGVKTIDELHYGVPSMGYSKACLFNRLEIAKMNFEAGSHKEKPISKEGFEVRYNSNPVALYHTKWRNPENGLGRAHNIAPRVSNDSTKKGWNYHYGLPDSVHSEYYINGMKNRIKVR